MKGEGRDSGSLLQFFEASEPLESGVTGGDGKKKGQDRKSLTFVRNPSSADTNN